MQAASHTQVVLCASNCDDEMVIPILFHHFHAVDRVADWRLAIRVSDHVLGAKVRKEGGSDSVRDSEQEQDVAVHVVGEALLALCVRPVVPLNQCGQGRVVRDHNGTEGRDEGLVDFTRSERD